jgi:hypothetical protein
LSPIAIRTWTHPRDWKPRHRPRPGPWPRAAFLLTTIARPVPGEPLRFGACALLPSLLPGQRPVDLRLFYPDDWPQGDLALLLAAAARHGLPPPLARDQLTRLFFGRTHRQGLPAVGFGLAPALGRLAAGWGPADGGGFSLILGSRPCPGGPRTAAERRRRPILPNGEIEDGYSPRVIVQPLDGRASIRFSSRRPDPQHRAADGQAGRPRSDDGFAGRFVDLATLATVQAGGPRFATAAEAAKAIGIHGEAAESSFDPPDDASIEWLLAELEQLASLYLRLLECHEQTPGGQYLSPDQVYSAASYADALLRAVGLDLPLQHSDLPESVHAQAMGAFFGGDCGIAVRHLDLPVAYLDTTGHYPVSAHLAGTFELLRATKLELVAEDPAELHRFLADLTAERLLNEPALWRRLGGTVCLVHPRDDLLPHRVPKGKSLMLKTAPLSSEQPLPYMLADLAVAALRDQWAGQIVSAFSVRAAPRRRKRLRRLTLPSGHSFEPRHDDLFLTLAEERLRLEQDSALTAAERERQAKLLKLIVNAACYGLFGQVNVKATPGDTLVIDLDGKPRTKRVDAIEEPGRWSMPLFAAGVTAVGRLLLHLCRLPAEQAAVVCTWDTDSQTAATTPDGNPIPFPEAGHPVPTLSHRQLAEVQADIERLCPYNPNLKTDPERPLLLALEPENFDPETGRQHQLYLHATAAKNYDLYTLDEAHPPTLTLVKWSEHGLGHVRTPGQPEQDDRAWIEHGRHHLLHQHLGLPTTRPDWWDEPAISVVSLNRPSELARLQDLLASPGGRTLLRPFSRLAIAHPNPLYARKADGQRRTPVAPFHADFDPRQARWRDLTSGESLTLRHPATSRLTEADLTTATPQRVLCETVGSMLERNNRRPEAKALDTNGHPCSRTTVGLLKPAPTEAMRLIPIGKETRNLERAGITEDPTYSIYSNVDDDAWRQTFLPTLRALAPGELTRGRPSRARRDELSTRAGRLAQIALRTQNSPHGIPRDPERACYLYLKTASRIATRHCACGCGEPAQGRSQYARSAHRTRAYRARLVTSQQSGHLVGSTANALPTSQEGPFTQLKLFGELAESNNFRPQ